MLLHGYVELVLKLIPVYVNDSAIKIKPILCFCCPNFTKNLLPGILSSIPHSTTIEFLRIPGISGILPGPAQAVSKG